MSLRGVRSLRAFSSQTQLHTRAAAASRCAARHRSAAQHRAVAFFSTNGGDDDARGGGTSDRARAFGQNRAAAFFSTTGGDDDARGGAGTSDRAATSERASGDNKRERFDAMVQKGRAKAQNLKQKGAARVEDLKTRQRAHADHVREIHDEGAGLSYGERLKRMISAYFRRADIPHTSRGDAAAATWVWRRVEADVAIPRRRVAATL